jgi:hypothetical protein
MATMPKLIKAALAFAHMLPEQLLAFGYAVFKAFTGNANLPAPPVDLGQLKTGLDNYSVLIAEAKDGSRKAIAARNKQGEDIIRMLRALALYAGLNCKDDMNTFLSSGFQPQSTTRTPAQPLQRPVILSIGQGISGQLLVSIKSVGRAKHYNLRYGQVGVGGATPATWSMTTVPNTKPAAQINGLTPGMLYAVQVRAYGKLGYTEWSDSITRMCI